LRLATYAENWCLRLLILALDRVHWVLGEPEEGARICHGKKSEHGRACDCMAPIRARSGQRATSAEQVAQNAAAMGKSYPHWTEWNWAGSSGETRPWRTNLSKIGEGSRKLLLPLLGAVSLRKKSHRGSRFHLKYQSCGSPRRVHFSRIRLSS
jgi:hypothetical protein